MNNCTSSKDNTCKVQNKCLLLFKLLNVTISVPTNEWSNFNCKCILKYIRWKREIAQYEFILLFIIYVIVIKWLHRKFSTAAHWKMGKVREMIKPSLFFLRSSHLNRILLFSVSVFLLLIRFTRFKSYYVSSVV